MIEFLLSVDYGIFFFLNGNLSNPVFDWFMPLLDKPGPMLLPFVLIWLVQIYRSKHKRLFITLLIPITILCVDQSGLFIKKMKLRSRPWITWGIEEVNHLGGSGGKQKSFPSNHAANSAALAVVFAYLLSRYKLYFWTFAGIIMFSRIYIGVHYPADIVAGAILGTLLALVIIRIFESIPFLDKKKGDVSPP